MEFLEHRVNAVDLLVCGSEASSKEASSIDVNQISDRLSGLQKALDSHEESHPNIRVCRDMVKQMKLQNKTILSSKQVVVELLAKKDDLLRTICTLQDMKKLEQFVDMPLSQDIPQLNERLHRVEAKIQNESIKIQSQTEELDSFLDVYHQLVNLMSDKCVEMKLKLDEVESRKS